MFLTDQLYILLFIASLPGLAALGLRVISWSQIRSNKASNGGMIATDGSSTAGGANIRIENKNPTPSPLNGKAGSFNLLDIGQILGRLASVQEAQIAADEKRDSSTERREERLNQLLAKIVQNEDKHTDMLQNLGKTAQEAVILCRSKRD